MGSALARALLAKGFEVTVWNRSPEKSAEFKGSAPVASSVIDACATSMVIIVCLLNYEAGNVLLRTPEVESLLSGKIGADRDATAWNRFVGLNVGFPCHRDDFPGSEPVYTLVTKVYTRRMTKRLVDIDEEALDAARSQLGTTTIKATVNEALRLVGSDRSEVVRNSMDVLAAMPLSDRDDAWR